MDFELASTVASDATDLVGLGKARWTTQKGASELEIVVPAGWTPPFVLPLAIARRGVYQSTDPRVGPRFTH